jgi:hypothetical protein
MMVSAACLMSTLLPPMLGLQRQQQQQQKGQFREVTHQLADISWS